MSDNPCSQRNRSYSPREGMSVQIPALVVEETLPHLMSPSPNGIWSFVRKLASLWDPELPEEVVTTRVLTSPTPDSRPAYRQVGVLCTMFFFSFPNFKLITNIFRLGEFTQKSGELVSL